jgi:hypothetical protein
VEQSVVAHNVHENSGKVQQGGTCLIMFETLTDQLDFNESGKDDTGLGRWSVMTVQGDGARARIVCGYNPCGNSKLNSGTTYQQHRQYFITQQKDLSCPRIRFREDLVKRLKQWREQGDKLIVCLDANKDIYKKLIGKALTYTEGLNMVEAVGEFTGKKIGPTFFRGLKPIDGTRLLITVSVFLFCFWKTQYFSGFLGFLQDSFVLHSNTGDNSYVAFYVIPYRYRAKAQGVLDTITQEQEWVITVPDQPKTVFYSNPEDYCSN